MKTYILKKSVLNRISFPIGTIITITDDYWPRRQDNLRNTGFTVVEGELKGKRGCVIDGLKNYLLDDTPENREIITNLQHEKEKLDRLLNELYEKHKKLPTPNLPVD